MALQPWLVCSPEYGEVVPILDDGTGPMEYGCDVVHVEAETREDALLLGVMLLKKQGARYVVDGENPYAGVKVESMICPKHGMPEWKGDHYDCPTCEAERD
jgi:hypothetical protein